MLMVIFYPDFHPLIGNGMFAVKRQSKRSLLWLADIFAYYTWSPLENIYCAFTATAAKINWSREVWLQHYI